MSSRLRSAIPGALAHPRVTRWLAPLFSPSPPTEGPPTASSPHAVLSDRALVNNALGIRRSVRVYGEGIRMGGRAGVGRDLIHFGQLEAGDVVLHVPCPERACPISAAVQAYTRGAFSHVSIHSRDGRLHGMGLSGVESLDERGFARGLSDWHYLVVLRDPEFGRGPEATRALQAFVEAPQGGYGLFQAATTAIAAGRPFGRRGSGRGSARKRWHVCSSYVRAALREAGRWPGEDDGPIAPAEFTDGRHAMVVGIMSNRLRVVPHPWDDSTSLTSYAEYLELERELGADDHGAAEAEVD